MKWSLNIGKIAGISVFVHWTFMILIGWIFVMHLNRGGLVAGLEGAGFVLAIFACVVLHELGHALTARRYGIKTKDITLLPIGGVARLERMPEEPKQELLVAAAGPAVNVVIALLIFAGLSIWQGVTSYRDPVWVGSSFWLNLMWINLTLVIFNLLPAFPMDGGRMLRALLAQRMRYARATRIAATIGQGMAIVFGFLGFFLNPFLIFIALFVYLGAQEESSMVEMRSAMEGLCVRDAMITHFRALAEEDTLGTASDELLTGWQHDFPVLRQGHLVGILNRTDLVSALSSKGRGARVSSVMRPEVQAIDESEALERALSQMRQSGNSTLPAVSHGQLVGLITLENIGELLMVHSALDPSKLQNTLEAKIEKVELPQNTRT